MFKKLAVLFASALLAGNVAFATPVPQADPVQMCGGIGWEGPTDCPAGFYCRELNEYVSLCVRESTNTEGTTRPGATGFPTIPVPGPTGVPPIPGIPGIPGVPGIPGFP
ncbi:hypothetical protein CC1G_06008 [Coprinopsis cinerea okayama7|uniref:CBM1 domain-containing protein n=1 Tax=Coprinopsis cinerea (strain Okayama-7 / 130 / ATCC MYA-4618 / FGSC 9003) TaxID=240176 RepID=A8N4N0_COPC7|nr:hypothetical protein CC1G_06008 [Coprinopsis cinerea okayama7\|eukprot:XP_001829799.1 hypothetical protein CC1G_06008 [Coprinopsis cinerea okayama7\